MYIFDDPVYFHCNKKRCLYVVISPFSTKRLTNVFWNGQSPFPPGLLSWQRGQWDFYQRQYSFVDLQKFLRRYLETRVTSLLHIPHGYNCSCWARHLRCRTTIPFALYGLRGWRLCRRVRHPHIGTDCHELCRRVLHSLWH